MEFPKEIRFTNIFAFKTFIDVLKKERPNCKWTAITGITEWTPPVWAFPLTIALDNNKLYVKHFEGSIRRQTTLEARDIDV